MQKAKSCELGRSMIEMLGVLAIIGVLSVGGIAGYSKAMEQFKINKTIEQYNYLIFGMLNYMKDIPKTTQTTCLLNIAEATGLIPLRGNIGIHAAYAMILVILSKHMLSITLG